MDSRFCLHLFWSSRFSHNYHKFYLGHNNLNVYGIAWITSKNFTKEIFMLTSFIYNFSVIKHNSPCSHSWPETITIQFFCCYYNVENAIYL